MYGVPRPAMWFNLAVSFVFLFFFRGWGTLAAVISVATIISYLTGPVSAMTLRRTAPELHRPMRLPGLPMFACLAFVFSTELLYWAKWPLTGEIILLIVVALPVYFYYQAMAGWHDFARQLARRMVADRVSAERGRVVVHRQYQVWRTRLPGLWLGPARGCRRRGDLLFLGTALRLAYAGSGRRNKVIAHSLRIERPVQFLA